MNGSGCSPRHPGSAATTRAARAGAWFWLAALLLALAPAVLPAHAKRAAFALEQEDALRRSFAVIGTVPDDFVFLGTDGNERRLSDFHGKPLLVNFLYTGCHRICPNSTLALKAAVEGMRQRFGSDQFQVASIGFDLPTDSPQAMRDYAVRRRISDPNWQFLSPRAEELAALVDAFGFSYAPTPAGFDHTLQVSVLDSSGRIYRQVHGDAFTADAIGEPLRQLVAGQLLSDSSGWTDLIGRIRILCSVYDPLTGHYRSDWTLFFMVAGGVTFVIAMLVFGWREWRSQRRLAADWRGGRT